MNARAFAICVVMMLFVACSASSPHDTESTQLAEDPLVPAYVHAYGPEYTVTSTVVAATGLNRNIVTSYYDGDVFEVDVAGVWHTTTVRRIGVVTTPATPPVAVTYFPFTYNYGFRFDGTHQTIAFDYGEIAPSGSLEDTNFFALWLYLQMTQSNYNDLTSPGEMSEPGAPPGSVDPPVQAAKAGCDMPGVDDCGLHGKCCDTATACYMANHCNSNSFWSYGQTTNQCKACNKNAIACLLKSQGTYPSKCCQEHNCGQHICTMLGDNIPIACEAMPCTWKWNGKLADTLCSAHCGGDGGGYGFIGEGGTQHYACCPAGTGSPVIPFTHDTSVGDGAPWPGNPVCRF